MALRIKCSCGKTLRVPDGYRGRRGKCPNCSNILEISYDVEKVPILEEIAERDFSRTPEDLYEQVVDSVVAVVDGDVIRGCGFFIDKSGIFVTNRHVVGSDEHVNVHTNDGSDYVGAIIRSYPDVDLAFARINVRPKRWAELAEQEALKVGEVVYAIGHAQGYQNTFTDGVVSAVGRLVYGQRWIQTNATINPGNSGGPLFNKYSHVVGVNTLVRNDSQGIGFAVPAEIVADRYREVILATKRLPSGRYCGICGKISSDTKYCEHCGITFGPVGNGSTSSEVHDDSGASVLSEPCAICSSIVTADDKYCPNCGSTLKRR